VKARHDNKFIIIIDSTLVNFKEDIGKEEAQAIKVYLRQAISKFTAFDYTPTLPPIPSYTRPKNLPIRPREAVTPVATSSQTQSQKHLATKKPPTNNQIYQKSWATMVRDGRKGVRTIPSISPKPHDTEISAQSISQKEQSGFNSQKNRASGEKKSSNTDKRLFLRLPQEHE
ncbi:putative eka-like protein, partial [Golovinomyces cichoracearum]